MMAETNFYALVSVMHVSEHSGHRDFEWAIEPGRTCLRLVGLWPEINEATNNVFVSGLRAIIVFVAIASLCVIPLLHAFVRVWGDMILMIDNLQITLPVLTTSLKLVIARWKQTVFSTLVKMMLEDWTKLKTNAERDVMMRQARIARVIMIYTYCLSLMSFSTFSLLPYFGLSFRRITNLTDGDRLLPLQTYYFYDTDKSPQFELTYATQVIAMFLVAIIYVSMDVFLAITILHICGQLENFKFRLNNLILLKDFDSVLRKNVRTHLRLIRFAKNIEDMFSLMMLGLTIYFGIALCFYMFCCLIVFSSNDSESFLRKYYSVIGIVIIFGQMFLYDGAGEMLIGQCEAVYRAICDLEWNELEPRKVRDLALLMRRANEPLRITAGKVIPLTMTTFCTLLKTSVSYVSVLMARRN